MRKFIPWNVAFSAGIQQRANWADNFSSVTSLVDLNQERENLIDVRLTNFDVSSDSRGEDSTLFTNQISVELVSK